jgi:hypothetical protein
LNKSIFIQNIGSEKKMKYNLEATLPPEACTNISKHSYWLSQGIKPEYGALHKKQQMCMNDIAKLCEDMDKMCTCIQSSEIKSSVEQMKSWLITDFAPFVNSIKPYN